MSEPMDNLDDQLEARLARLEAGEPVEACLDGLPEAEAALVRQAAGLRATPIPAPDPALVARQRREYLRAAAALHAPHQPARARRPAWLVPGLALAGMAALALCVFVPLALGALAWLRGQQGIPVAQASPGATQGALPEATNLTSTQSATGLPATTVAIRPPDAQSAVLRDARGLVELQDAEGPWQAVVTGQVVHTGQRLRTGALSGVTLALFDGSQAQLGAQSELSIDELDARTGGARVVALTQWLGESTHAVTPSSDLGSRYAVNTPNGAVTAKGTVFHVQVSPTLLVRFAVDEGAVDVTHQAVTVLVVAGQSTIVTADQPPSAPAFLISGEGQLQAMGHAWQIAGREFVTHANTMVFGEPQVGDWVSFEGRVIDEGLRVLDKIVLLHRAADNHFTLVGQVTVIGATEWTIGGRPVRVDAETQLDPGLAIGAWVEVTGGISADGDWWASRIRPLNEPGGALAYRFAGTVQSQSDTLWTVAGISVTVDAQTAIDADLTVGDVVLVEGRLLDDGRWLAESIRRITPGEAVFEITGVLNSLEPLTVGGIRLVTAARTEMDKGLAVGDRVRAEGRILDDGTWLAEEVKRLDEGTASAFEFVGVVNTRDPWVVAGIPLSVTAETEIDPGIAAGDLVRVEGQILPDGTWLAREIRRLDDDLGCLDLRGIVARIEGNQIALTDGQVIDLEGVTVVGQLDIAVVIVIIGCVGEDGQFLVITIIVIYQLPELPPTPTPGPTPTPQPTRPPAESDKVTICHRPPGNPDNAHTITVGASAVPAHLAHGDSLGPCP
jgi:hypothetical protein